MKTLVAPCCTLEPQVAAHAREMFAVLSDPAIYEFENSPPVSEQWLRERYRRLETRGPTDGSQRWLNWVVRLPTGELAGYVQATVCPDGSALAAYELNSRYWRQGIGSAAVQAMLDALQADEGVHRVIAVLKCRNHRSMGLLHHLGFVPASPSQSARYRDEADETVLVKTIGKPMDAA